MPPWAGWGAAPPTEAIQKGRTFLVNLMDPDLGLLPEYRGASVYWLFHDNYLAAKVLAQSYPLGLEAIKTREEPK